MADSMEMSILAILGPAVRCEWRLTHWHEAFLTTASTISSLSLLLSLSFSLYLLL